MYCGGAERHAGTGESALPRSLPLVPRSRSPSRSSEVGHHRLTFVKEDVLGLDVAMDQATAVRVFQGGRDLAHDAESLLDRELLFPGKAGVSGTHRGRRA